MLEPMLTQRYVWVPCALFVIVAVVGCSSLETETCTGALLPSVSISLVDASGNRVRDAKVTYTVDGGPIEIARCQPVGDAGCETWFAGEERRGTFSITATSVDGSKTARRDVVATSGKCGHVESVAITMTLQ